MHMPAHVHRYPDGRVKVHEPVEGTNQLVSRRSALGLAGAAAAATTLGLANPVSAHVNSRESEVLPVPRPIPGGVEDPLAGFIHWWLPGPIGTSTPIIGIPGFGLDVDPSTMTDFKGYTAYAVVDGEATGSDGETYGLEADIRVMDGDYVADDGETHNGAFAFI